MRRLLHLVSVFIDIARASGLPVALKLSWRKLWRKAGRLNRKFATRVLPSASIPPQQLERMARAGCRVSVVVPVHDTPPDLLEECIRSVLEQAYPNWELCICDDASTREDTRLALEAHRGTDPRIRIVRSEAPLHIARASNLAAEQATGKYLAFLDHDDRLHPAALYEIARADLDRGDIDVMYTDEDKLDASGRHCDTYLKPDWSPEHLDSVMYVLHLLVVRKSLFWALEGLRHEVSGAQDYDLALRACAKARHVHHIDKVLYHWRMIAGSAAAQVNAKPYALQAARRALADSLAERGLQAEVGEGLLPGTFRTRRAVRGDPPVTLLILTNHGKRDIPGRGEVRLLDNFVTSVVERSTYRNYRIVVVDNGNAADDTRRMLAGCAARLVTYARTPSFNFPKQLNFALQSVDTEQVLLLNDDLEVISPDWIESLLEFSQDPDIGVAGAQLFYPDGRIQHAGIVLGVNGSAAHIFHGMPGSQVGYNGYSHLVRNYSAVTGAVMATRMSILAKTGGFDEQFAIDFNDVDFCLRVRALGLRIVYTPYCRLVHFEGSSLKRTAQNPAEVALFSQRWRALIARDPYYNVNLPRDSADLMDA